ncbi:MAG: cell division protein FtsZ, partial [Actinobacteria bacterium]|nr:cell division protein FtsZ [Actinomycetota bacterium]
SRGDDRAVAAAEMAISSPLLEASIDGAHGVLLSIQGGSDLGLFEINEAAQLVSNSAAVDANIIFGAVIDDALGDEVRVTVIAAGLDGDRTGRPAAGADAASLALGGNGSGDAITSAGPSAGGSAPSGGAGGSLYGTAGPAAAPAGAVAAPAGAVAVPAGAIRPGSAGHSVLGAPVPDRGLAAPAAPAAAAPSPAAREPARPQTAATAPPDHADPAAYRLAHAEAAAKAFDAATARRRPVVFEEDDDLDVPDFLK